MQLTGCLETINMKRMTSHWEVIHVIQFYLLLCLYKKIYVSGKGYTLLQYVATTYLFFSDKVLRYDEL